MYQLAPHVVYDVDSTTNTAYLMDIINGSIYKLNDTAAVLIQYLVENKPLEDYVDYIWNITEKVVEKNNILQDTSSYLDRLEGQGLLLS